MLRRGCGTLQPDGRYYGSGVTETDRSLSAKYFEEAAKSGDPLAIGNLAFFHLDGKVHTHAAQERTHTSVRARAHTQARAACQECA
jgi:TPR repeat protein